MSIVLHTGVMMLAQRRLRELRAAFRRKDTAGTFESDGEGRRSPVQIRNPDRQIAALIDKALELMEGDPKIGNVASDAVLGHDLSRFAVFGSVALELPSFTDAFAAEGGWATQMLHGGTPDPNRSRVLVRTSEFVLRAARLALDRASTDEDKRAIRAWALGTLCSIASDLVVGPVLRGAQAQADRREWDRFSSPALIPAEQRVIRDLFRRPTGGDWSAWWPDPARVPNALYEGYAAALREVFYDDGRRPQGFRAFERGLSASSVTADELANAYRVFRAGELGIGRGWSWFAWWGVLTPTLIMPTLALLTAKGVDRASKIYSADPPPTPNGAPDGRTWLELMSIGGFWGSLMPLVYPMILWSGFPTGNAPFIEAIVMALWRLVMMIVFAANSSSTASIGERIAIMIVQFVPDLVALVQQFFHDEPGFKLVLHMQWLPLATALLTLAGGAIFHAANVTWEPGSAIPALVLFGVILLGLGMLAGWGISANGGFTTFVLRNRTPNRNFLATLPGPTATADPRALAALFDRSTLWTDPGAPAEPTLAHVNFPSGKRDLVRVWWTGDRPFKLNVDGAIVTWQLADGSTESLTIPPGTTAAGLVTVLHDGVHDMDATRKLQAEVVHADEIQYPLPFPSILSDPGDTSTTLDDHERHRGDLRDVGATRDRATILSHATRAHAVTTFGTRGPSASPIEGWKIVPSAALGDTDVTAMGTAADLAAMLCLAATPSIASPRPKVGATDVPEVFQLFRQYNLDARRVNEWRLLVAGGAAGERPSGGGTVDPMIRRPPSGYTVTDPGGTGAGETIANTMGWVPLWRTWSRVATDVTAATDEPAPMRWVPDVPRADGTVTKPTNRELTDAIRFLLDLG